MAETEEKLKPIRAILETIRERADYALKLNGSRRRSKSVLCGGGANSATI